MMITDAEIAHLLSLDWLSFNRQLMGVETSDDAKRLLASERSRPAGPRKSYEMRIKRRISRLIYKETMADEESVRRGLRDESNSKKARVSTGTSRRRTVGRTTR